LNFSEIYKITGIINGLIRVWLNNNIKSLGKVRLGDGKNNKEF